MKLGSTIRSLRTRRNLTLAELADQLNLSESYVCLVENDLRSFNLNRLTQLSLIFNIKLSRIIYLAEEAQA